LGRCQTWLVPPVQVQISCWVPSTVDDPGSSRHLPEPVPTREVPDPAVHCWLVPPLQVHSSTSVPLAVPRAVTSRHLPPNWMASPHTVQLCPPPHVVITTGVPLVVAFPCGARHLPARPEVIGPVCVPPPDPVAVTARLSHISVR